MSREMQIEGIIANKKRPIDGKKGEKVILKKTNGRTNELSIQLKRCDL